MSILDTTLLDDLQRAVIEGPPAPDLGVSWPSGLWTRDEVIAYANQRLQRYLQETLVTASWSDQVLVPNQPIHQLPQEWLATAHVIAEIDGSTAPVDPVSRPEVDLTLYGWQQQPGRPLGYVELQTGTLSWELVPTPLVGGLLHVFGTWLAEALDGSGVEIGLPDDLVPYLYYGILADMFSKQGRAFNLPLRDYCEDRWNEGVAVGRAMFEAVRVP